MSFELGSRIKSALNSWSGEEPTKGLGTVVVVLRNGELQFLNDEVKNDEEIEHYLEPEQYMTNDEDVIVLFDDGHYEWGYDGDCDFYPLED